MTDVAQHEIGDGTALREMRFHVVNFPLLHGHLVRYGNHVHPSGLRFAYGPWVVRLDQVPTASDAMKELEARGGYRFTHAGSLTRIDDTLVSVDEARQLLEAMGYFLAFAAGANCGPILPVGFDANDEPVWAEWATPGVDSWVPRFMWLDEHEGFRQLETLFPRFMACWGEASVEAVLRTALHYYAASNVPPSVDAALVLGFVALEALERASLGAASHRDADSRLRMTLEKYGIPTTIPKRLEQLTILKSRNAWTDGPKTLIQMRHRVAHPQLTSPLLPVRARVEAWLLMTWYIELVILALIGYDGTYRNRLQREMWVGQVDPVPWRHN